MLKDDDSVTLSKLFVILKSSKFDWDTWGTGSVRRMWSDHPVWLKCTFKMRWKWKYKRILLILNSTSVTESILRWHAVHKKRFFQRCLPAKKTKRASKHSQTHSGTPFPFASHFLSLGFTYRNIIYCPRKIGCRSGVHGGTSSFDYVTNSVPGLDSRNWWSLLRCLCKGRWVQWWVQQGNGREEWPIENFHQHHSCTITLGLLLAKLFFFYGFFV